MTPTDNIGARLFGIGRSRCHHPNHIIIICKGGFSCKVGKTFDILRDLPQIVTPGNVDLPGCDVHRNVALDGRTHELGQERIDQLRCFSVGCFELLVLPSFGKSGETGRRAEQDECGFL